MDEELRNEMCTRIRDTQKQIIKKHTFFRGLYGRFSDGQINNVLHNLAKEKKIEPKRKNGQDMYLINDGQ